MELYADPARIAALESGLPGLAAGERVGALAELAWHLRERDTRRARALALEARSLLAGVEGDRIDALSARIVLTLAECARLFGESEEAERGALRALDAFGLAGDTEGTADAKFLLARLGRRPHDEAALESRGGADVANCHAAYVAAHADRQAGALDRATAGFSRVAAEAPAHGMDEIALESELALADLLARLGDDVAARESGEAVLASARERGWRPLLCAATASLCRTLLDVGKPQRARELLHEARASLASLSPPRRDAQLECLMGRAQYAAGDPQLAAGTLEGACKLLRERGPTVELAEALVQQACAHGASGAIDAALACANEALRVARETRGRAAEAAALHALGDLHASHPAPDRTPRSAIAYLRHAAEISDEIGDGQRKAALLRAMARLHESVSDLGAALAAERTAQAHATNALRARLADARLAASAGWLRERHRVLDLHARELDAERARHSAQLHAAYDTVDRLCAAGQDLMAAGDGATLVAAIERHLAPLADAHFIGLFAFDRAGSTLVRYAREGGRAIPVREIAAADLESYAARAARERRELHVELESAVGGHAPDLRDTATLWFGPVSCGDDVLGVLTVQSRRQRAYAARDMLAFRSLAAHAATALAKARVHEELRAQRTLRIETEERLHRLATVDAPTGLATRAHFFAVARERLERARRDAAACGLIVADVDAFKSLNDTRGHAAGDRVLAAVAGVIARHQSGDDIAGRIGGEEFAMLLPGAPLEAIVRAAERIRMDIEALRISHEGRPVPVTVSLGCSAVADAAADIADKTVAETLERLLRESDAALFEAQGTGGNRTIAWPAYQALRALRLGPALERPPQSFA